MEAANVFFVPGLALYLGWPRTTIEAVALTTAILAVAGFLIVGTLYWRGIDRRLKGLGKRSLAGALAFADGAEKPMLIVLAAATLATVVAYFAQGWSRSVIAAAILTLLAALEYVNYYRWQLQYFDNMADLKRLLGGQLKRAHLGRDLEEYRARTRPRT